MSKRDLREFFKTLDGKTSDERMKALQGRLAEQSVITQLRLMESTQLIFGPGGQATELVVEDPRTDDGQVWDETGFGRGIQPGDGKFPRNRNDLAQGRRMGRRLFQTNGFARGAHSARVSYVIGTGHAYELVPKDPERAKTDPVLQALADEANKRLKAFLKANVFPRSEREGMIRSDRDGEQFVRLFPNADGPAKLRFAEPEDVRDPQSARAGLEAQNGPDIEMGVEVNNVDVRTVVAYWIADGLKEDSKRVPVIDKQSKLQQVFHLKLNVDLNQRRGWPTLWPVRRNLIRADRLLRYANNVAAIQSAVASVWKHSQKTKAQVETFLDQNNDALLIDNTTGRQTRLQGTTWGEDIHLGPGVELQAPIVSIDPQKIAGLVQMDLREVAADLQMAEFMLTADASNNNFASSLVAESPPVRNFQRLQQEFGEFNEEIVWTGGVVHEVELHGLDRAALTELELTRTPPTLEVRNPVEDAQTNQILLDNDITSRKRWRESVGNDNQEIDRELAVERAGPATPGSLLPPVNGGIPDQQEEPIPARRI